MRWHRFPFLIGNSSNNTCSPWLPGGIDTLTAFGVVHDAIDHGMLGLPFSTAGELAALGARVLWYDEKVKGSWGNPISGVFRTVASLDPAVHEQHHRTMFHCGKTRPPLMEWPGLNLFTPLAERNKRTLDGMAVFYTQCIENLARGCPEFSSMGMVPLSHEFAFDHLALGLLSCMHRLVGPDPSNEKAMLLAQRAKDAITVVHSLKFQATYLYAKNDARPCVYEVQVTTATPTEPADIRIVSWVNGVATRVTKTEVLDRCFYEVVHDAGVAPPYPEAHPVEEPVAV